jgi:hypothetical protein
VALSATVSFIPSASADDYGDCYADNGDPYPATDGAGNIQPSFPTPPCVPVGSVPLTATVNVASGVDPVTAAIYDVTTLPEIVPNVGAAPSDTGVPLPGVTIYSGGTPSLDHNYCDDDYTYHITKRYADAFTAAWSETDYNKNAADAGFSWTENKSTTKGASVSASFSVEEGVIFASAKETYGVSAQINWTSATGSTAHVDHVPPGHTATGAYGIFRLVTDGSYVHTDKYCNVTNLGNVRAYSPYREAWITSED